MNKHRGRGANVDHISHADTDSGAAKMSCEVVILALPHSAPAC
ncbi:hypothetical protein ACXR2T_02250 [Leucobacter sp. HY1910]